jgi:hypothetical protein
MSQHLCNTLNAIMPLLKKLDDLTYEGAMALEEAAKVCLTDEEYKLFNRMVVLQIKVK